MNSLIVDSLHNETTTHKDSHMIHWIECFFGKLKGERKKSTLSKSVINKHEKKQGENILIAWQTPVSVRV